MVSVIEIDLHEWLPGWGESQVTTRSVGGDFIIDVTYDGKDGGEEAFSLVFSRVCFFSVGSFPGLKVLGMSSIILLKQAQFLSSKIQGLRMHGRNTG